MSYVRHISRTRATPAIGGKVGSVRTSQSLPNGAKEDTTEQGTEQAAKHLEQYRQGVIRLPELYKRLRALWGDEVFEGTRHCYENMKQRTREDYAPLDPRFETLPDFLQHMGPRPYKTASIHRKDNHKGYSPENCEWADKTTQARVRSNTVYLTCDGETLPLTEWAARLGSSARTLRARKDKGWTDYEVIHGRPDATAPWPKGEEDWWEAGFQEAGGGKHKNRLRYLRDQMSARMERLWPYVENAFYPDEFEPEWPSPCYQKQVEDWCKQYNFADHYYRKAREELKKIELKELFSPYGGY